MPPVRTIAPSLAPTAVPVAPAAATAGAVIQTCIEGDFEGWSGETVFELCNGQVWVQVSYAYTYHYAYRPKVTLVRSGSSWTMAVDGVRSTIRVQQITNFTRTCISGTFEGWTGSTIFPLCNGQIWQQSGYDYRYHYAYRPSVLIYESPFGGYRMVVEGVDETVRVTRLR